MFLTKTPEGQKPEQSLVSVIPQDRLDMVKAVSILEAVLQLIICILVMIQN